MKTISSQLSVTSHRTLNPEAGFALQTLNPQFQATSDCARGTPAES